MNRSLTRPLVFAAMATCAAAQVLDDFQTTFPEWTDPVAQQAEAEAAEPRERRDDFFVEIPEQALAGRPLADDMLPVVMVHGYSPWYRRAPVAAGEVTWGPARQAHSGLERYKRDRLRLYAYYYRPNLPYPELAARMAETLQRELLGAGGAAADGRPVLFLTHSAGALLTRYAGADPRLRGRVAGIVSLSGPLRGSVRASLATARNLEQHPGMTEEYLEVLERVRADAEIDPRVAAADPDERLPCEADPVCAVVASLAYDNYDGVLDAQDQERFGLLVNHELADFQARDPNLGKLIAYQGNIQTLDAGEGAAGAAGQVFGMLGGFGGGEDRVAPAELERRGLAALEPSWSTVDPVVHLASGTLADPPQPLRLVRVLYGVSHAEMLRDPDVLRRAFIDLRFMAQDVFQARSATGE